MDSASWSNPRLRRPNMFDFIFPRLRGKKRLSKDVRFWSLRRNQTVKIFRCPIKIETEKRRGPRKGIENGDKIKILRKWKSSITRQIWSFSKSKSISARTFQMVVLLFTIDLFPSVSGSFDICTILLPFLFLSSFIIFFFWACLFPFGKNHVSSVHRWDLLNLFKSFIGNSYERWRKIFQKIKVQFAGTDFFGGVKIAGNSAEETVGSKTRKYSTCEIQFHPHYPSFHLCHPSDPRRSPLFMILSLSPPCISFFLFLSPFLSSLLPPPTSL